MFVVVCYLVCACMHMCVCVSVCLSVYIHIAMQPVDSDHTANNYYTIMQSLFAQPYLYHYTPESVVLGSMIVNHSNL